MFERLGCIFQITYFAVGAIALVATWDGVEEFLGVHSIVAFVITLCIVYVPLLGQIAGVYGATEVWGWEMWQAILLFFGPFVLILLGSMAISFFDSNR